MLTFSLQKRELRAEKAKRFALFFGFFFQSLELRNGEIAKDRERKREREPDGAVYIPSGNRRSCRLPAALVSCPMSPAIPGLPGTRVVSSIGKRSRCLIARSRASSHVTWRDLIGLILFYYRLIKVTLRESAPFLRYYKLHR